MSSSSQEYSKKERPQLYVKEVDYNIENSSHNIFQKQPIDINTNGNIDLANFFRLDDKDIIERKRKASYGLVFAISILGAFTFSQSLFQHFKTHQVPLTENDSKIIKTENINNQPLVKSMTSQAQDSLETILEHTFNPTNYYGKKSNIQQLFTEEGFKNWNNAVKDSQVMDASHKNKDISTVPIVGKAKLISIGVEKGQQFSIYSIPVTLQYMSNNENLLISGMAQMRVVKEENNINKIASVTISEQSIDRL